jgi:hypothetical protein
VRQLASCCRTLRTALSPVLFRHLTINVRGERWQQSGRWKGYKRFPANSSKELSQCLAHYASRVVAPFVRSIEIKLRSFDERVAGTWSIDSGQIFSILPRFTHLTSLIVGRLHLHAVVITGVPKLTPFQVKALHALTSLTSLEISNSCIPQHISEDLPQLRLKDLRITNDSQHLCLSSLRLDPDHLETLAVAGPIPPDLPKTLPRLRSLDIRGGGAISRCLQFLVNHHCPNLDALALSPNAYFEFAGADVTDFKPTPLALKTYVGPTKYVDLFTQNGTNLVTAELMGWHHSAESILCGLRIRAVQLRSLKLIGTGDILSPRTSAAACSFPRIKHLSFISVSPRPQLINNVLPIRLCGCGPVNVRSNAPNLVQVLLLSVCRQSFLRCLTHQTIAQTIVSLTFNMPFRGHCTYSVVHVESIMKRCPKLSVIHLITDHDSTVYAYDTDWQICSRRVEHVCTPPRARAYVLTCVGG